MAFDLNNLLSRIGNNSTIYPVQKKRTSQGRVKFKFNETFYCETSFDDISKPNASPTKIRRYVLHREKFTNKEIKEHIDIKVRLFADTLTKVRNTPFHYSIGKTRAQGVSAGKIKIQDNGKTYIETLQAVHSSALPALTVQNRQEYNEWMLGVRDEEPEKYLFIAKSSYDCNQNSTRNLPSIVNLVDRILEGGAKNEKLRIKMVEIVNETAEGKHTIEEGIHLFLQAYKDIIKEKIEELSEESTGLAAKKKRVCTKFLRYVENQVEGINEEYISKLLDLPSLSNLENEEKEKVLELRCGLAVKTSGVESAISHEMSPIKRAALGRRKRSPHNFNAGMMQYILENTKSLEAKRALLRQFNVSEEQLKATGDCLKAYAFIKQKNIDISHFEAEVKKKWDEMQALKNAYRIDLIQFMLARRKITTHESVQKLLTGEHHLNAAQLRMFAKLIDLDIRFFDLEYYEL